MEIATQSKSDNFPVLLMKLNIPINGIPAHEVNSSFSKLYEGVEKINWSSASSIPIPAEYKEMERFFNGITAIPFEETGTKESYYAFVAKVHEHFEILGKTVDIGFELLGGLANFGIR